MFFLEIVALTASLIVHVIQYTVYCTTLFVYIWDNWEKPRKQIGILPNRIKNCRYSKLIGTYEVVASESKLQAMVCPD